MIKSGIHHAPVVLRPGILYSLVIAVLVSCHSGNNISQPAAPDYSNQMPPTEPPAPPPERDSILSAIPGADDYRNSITINETEVMVRIGDVQLAFRDLEDLRAYLVSMQEVLKNKPLNVITGSGHSYKVLAEVTGILRELNIPQGSIFR